MVRISSTSCATKAKKKAQSRTWRNGSPRLPRSRFTSQQRIILDATARCRTSTFAPGDGMVKMFATEDSAKASTPSSRSATRSSKGSLRPAAPPAQVNKRTQRRHPTAMGRLRGSGEDERNPVVVQGLGQPRCEAGRPEVGDVACRLASAASPPATARTSSISSQRARRPGSRQTLTTRRSFHTHELPGHRLEPGLGGDGLDHRLGMVCRELIRAPGRSRRPAGPLPAAPSAGARVERRPPRRTAVRGSRCSAVEAWFDPDRTCRQPVLSKKFFVARYPGSRPRPERHTPLPCPVGDSFQQPLPHPHLPALRGGRELGRGCRPHRGLVVSENPSRSPPPHRRSCPPGPTRRSPPPAPQQQ